LQNTPALLENTLALFKNKWHLSFVKMALMEDIWKRKIPLPSFKIPINTCIDVDFVEVEEIL
jgi:hypothetical protein